jgi:hypothetical protein
MKRLLNENEPADNAMGILLKPFILTRYVNWSFQNGSRFICEVNLVLLFWQSKSISLKFYSVIQQFEVDYIHYQDIRLLQDFNALKMV